VNTHRGLRDIPDRLLLRRSTPAAELNRQRRLVAWLERANIRASLLDLEHERWRRGLDSKARPGRPTVQGEP